MFISGKKKKDKSLLYKISIDITFYIKQILSNYIMTEKTKTKQIQLEQEILFVEVITTIFLKPYD